MRGVRGGVVKDVLYAWNGVRCEVPHALLLILTRSQVPRALRPSPQNPPGCGEVAGGAGMPRCSRRNGRATALRVVARLAWVFMYEVGTALARPSATCIYEPTARANNPPPSPF